MDGGAQRRSDENETESDLVHGSSVQKKRAWTKRCRPMGLYTDKFGSEVGRREQGRDGQRREEQGRRADLGWVDTSDSDEQSSGRLDLSGKNRAAGESGQ